MLLVIPLTLKPLPSLSEVSLRKQTAGKINAKAVALSPPVSSKTIPRSQVRSEMMSAAKVSAVVMMTCSRVEYSFAKKY